MSHTTTCPECGTVLPEGQTCRDHFDQMLYWEAEDPALGVVHHLMVLCYHLQHPSLYSPKGLTFSRQLLTDFVEHGVSTEEVRRRNRTVVDSGNRKWKITGTPTSYGVYDRPIHWTMTAADVVAAGIENYREMVRTWAQSVHEALKA
jgi:hypothetical protein